MTTLFQKLGGKEAVNAAVDIFYNKVLADDRVKGFFTGVDMKQQIAKQKMFLTYAFGGMPNYSGKSMREAHKHLKLNDEHFNIIVQHLGNTLNELKVPADLIKEVAAIAESVRNDVLNK